MGLRSDRRRRSTDSRLTVGARYRAPVFPVAVCVAGATVPSVDLALQLDPTSGESVALRYRDDLFELTTADRFAGQLHQLAVAAAAHPDRPVNALGQLSPNEAEQLTMAYNDTAVPFDDGATVARLVETRRRPPRPPSPLSVTIVSSPTPS